MRLRDFILLGFVALFVGACSDTTSTLVDDSEDDVLFSSNSKGKSSSSRNVDTENPASEIDEDCIGESGKPWDGTTAKEFACGSGTKLSPYVILTAEQLAHLSFVVGAKDKDYLEKYYKLGADIILNGGKVIDENGGLVADSAKLHKWTPIGNSSIAFAGSFDGDGHTISGMFINTTSTHNGLFGNSSGTIQNLTVENGWVSGGDNTASVVGYNKGMVSNAVNKGSVVGIKECTGGVVGQSYTNVYKARTKVDKSTNKGFVTGGTAVGGVVGCVQNSDLSTLLNEGVIEGSIRVGGIVGSAKNGSVSAQNLVNKGEISATENVGGVMGICGGGGTGKCYDNVYLCEKVENAQNYGKIIGKNFVGGVLGMLCGGKSSGMTNSANVEGEKYVAGIAGFAGFSTTSSMYNVGDNFGKTRVGGVFGYNHEGITSSAYSTGKVDGDSLVGLMIGYNYNTTMADYYYLKQGEQEPFGLNDGGGVATSKTDSEMKSDEFAELLGENFTYDPEVNNGYPILKWKSE